jgi:hypothetical protein
LTGLCVSARAGVQMETHMDTIDHIPAPAPAPVPPPVPARPSIEKPWYHSKGVVGAVVAVAALGASMAGYQIAPETQAQVVEAWLNIVALGGAVISLIGRLTASKRLS